MDAAWAQAYLSGAAILASGAFAVLIPLIERRQIAKREARARLNITTTRWAPNSLKLEIHYVPEFTHVGLSANVLLLSPNIRLVRGRPCLNPAPIGHPGNYVRYEFDGPFIGNQGQVRLLRSDDGIFTGVMFLQPGDESLATAILSEANIRVAIVTDSGEVLQTTSLHVSPIDDAQRIPTSSPLHAA